MRLLILAVICSALLSAKALVIPDQQQFHAETTGSATLLWSADCGSIDSAGLYTSAEGCESAIVTADYGTASAELPVMIAQNEPPPVDPTVEIMPVVRGGDSLEFDDGSKYTAPPVTEPTIVTEADFGPIRVIPGGQPPPPVAVDCQAWEDQGAIIIAPGTQVDGGRTCAEPGDLDYWLARPALQEGGPGPGGLLALMPGVYTLRDMKHRLNGVDRPFPSRPYVVGENFWVRAKAPITDLYTIRCMASWPEGECQIAFSMNFHNENVATRVWGLSFIPETPDHYTPENVPEDPGRGLEPGSRAGIGEAFGYTELINNRCYDTPSCFGGLFGGEVNNNSAGALGPYVYGNHGASAGWINPGRHHGNIFYVQNNPERVLEKKPDHPRNGRAYFVENSAWRAYRHGAQIYGTGAAFVRGFRIQDNLFANSLARQIIHRTGGSIGDNEFERNFFWTGSRLPGIVGFDSEATKGYPEPAGGPGLTLRENRFFTPEGGTGLGARFIEKGSYDNVTAVGNTGNAIAYDTFDGPQPVWVGGTQVPDEVRVLPNKFDTTRAKAQYYNGSKAATVDIPLPPGVWRAYDSECLRCGVIVDGAEGTMAWPTESRGIDEPTGDVGRFEHSSVAFGEVLLRAVQ